MAGAKQPTSFEVQQDLLSMLDNIAQKYELPDRGKALRCILDYIAKDANWNEIFSVTRCLRCGGRPGWTEDQ